MNRTLIALAAFGLFAVGCEGEDPTTPLTEGPQVTPQADGANKVVHRVSTGSSDIVLVGPGGDANFSLHATERADGSVKGRYNDNFGHGNGGIKADITCLKVDGNQAWVSGPITGGQLVGFFVQTRVRDNGKSQQDPEDQISFSFGAASADACLDMPDLPLFDINGGQIKVR